MAELLRIPRSFHSVDEVLSTAGKLDLPNVLVMAEMEDGRIVFLSTEMTLAQTNWLLDRMKMLMLMPNSHEKVG